MKNVTIFILFLFACSSEHDPDFFKPSGLVSSITTTYVDDYGERVATTSTSYLYNHQEKLAKKVVQGGGETRSETFYSYNQEGKLLKKETHRYEKPPNSSINTYEYKDGLMTKEIVVNEGVRYFFYDENHLLWNSRYYPIEGTGLRDIIYEYDSLSGLLKYETMYLSQRWDGKQEVYYQFEYNYNDQGEIVNKMLLQGSPKRPLPRIETEYFYENGRLSREVHYMVDMTFRHRVDKFLGYEYY